MTTNCVISFDNCAARVFYSGEFISGRVILTVGQEQSVKSKNNFVAKIQKKSREKIPLKNIVFKCAFILNLCRYYNRLKWLWIL